MEKKAKKEGGRKTSVPLPCSSDLRGRQSVRVTFKLTGRAIDTIRIVATHLGIKQKSLFDHLVDDIVSLNLIARDIEQDSFNKLNRIQKTYVISRRTLSNLEDTCRKYSAPRDALVEFSIQRLLPIISEEREKHRRRKDLQCELTEYLKSGKKILERSRKSLGEDDPVYEKLETAMKALYNTHSSIESFIKKGEVIEGF